MLSWSIKGLCMTFALCWAELKILMALVYCLFQLWTRNSKTLWKTKRGLHCRKKTTVRLINDRDETNHDSYKFKSQVDKVLDFSKNKKIPVKLEKSFFMWKSLSESRTSEDFVIKCKFICKEQYQNITWNNNKMINGPMSSHTKSCARYSCSSYTPLPSPAYVSHSNTNRNNVIHYHHFVVESERESFLPFPSLLAQI